MRVKLCARCPYTPQDLASYYDPEAALHACAKCDHERAAVTRHYPREAERRQRSSTVPALFGMAQRSATQLVPKRLVASATTPAELSSVQRNALSVSGAPRRTTADGYSDFALPEEQLQ
jgi:hypothetical protein